MKNLKKYNDTIILSYISVALLLFIFLVFLVSCDTCGTDNSGGDGNKELRIFFTAVPVNGTIPSVFSINPEGNDLKEIISNAIIYSPPSDNGKIAFLRKENGVNSLYLSDLTGQNEKLIERDNNQFQISFPVLSSDGGKIAFYGSDSELYIYRPSNFSIERIASDFIGSSIPSFSPDSKKLAFFTQNSSNEFTVNIIDADNPEVVYLSKVYSGVINGEYYSSIQWQNDGELVIFSYFDLNNNEFLVNLALSGASQDGELKFQKDLPGILMPDISYNSELFCFISKDGELLTRNLSGEANFSTLAKSDDDFQFAYPDWNEDDNYILVNKVYSGDNFVNSNYSDILVMKISQNGTIAFADRTFLISNNSFRGFWKRI